MNENEWLFGKIVVTLHKGPLDDSEFDVAVTSKEIPLPLPSPTNEKEKETSIITVMEKSTAKAIIYWPAVSLLTPERRAIVFRAAKEALRNAIQDNANTIGFFTTGLEILGIPSWEIAEEIVKAIYLYSIDDVSLSRVGIITGSSEQISAFIFALNNIPLILNESD